MTEPNTQANSKEVIGTDVPAAADGQPQNQQQQRKGGGRGERRGRRGERRGQDRDSEWQERGVQIRRVSKTGKGCKKNEFSCNCCSWK